MRLLVTGSRGFIGKNLVLRLNELKGFEVLRFDRGDALSTLGDKVLQVDAVVHLAGENRPKDMADFDQGNAELTKALCAAVLSSGRKIPLVLASSTQATLLNPYGQSKRLAELAVEQLALTTGNPSIIYRLPNVFGKWCKPNYNSVVATFCHSIVHDLPIKINNPSTQLRLVYVDDVVSEFLHAINTIEDGMRWEVIGHEYLITLGELAAQIEAFKNCRSSLISERVGIGLVRALYSTYVSYLPPSKFAYDLPSHGDERGVFVEMLKTVDSGQFSYFTVRPGATRGGHYHHSKTEKFFVVKGSARLDFRNVVTDETYEVLASGEVPQVIETVPGWAHNITNVGDDELIVMIWANEIFDYARPDTIACRI